MVWLFWNYRGDVKLFEVWKLGAYVIVPVSTSFLVKTLWKSECTSAIISCHNVWDFGRFRTPRRRINARVHSLCQLHINITLRIEDHIVGTPALSHYAHSLSLYDIHNGQIRSAKCPFFFLTISGTPLVGSQFPLRTTWMGNSDLLCILLNKIAS